MDDAPKRAVLPLPGDVRKEPVELRLDDLVALARPCFQSRAIEHRNLASALTNQPRILQLACSLGDAFAANAQHVCDQFLRHRDFAR